MSELPSKSARRVVIVLTPGEAWWVGGVLRGLVTPEPPNWPPKGNAERAFRSGVEKICKAAFVGADELPRGAKLRRILAELGRDEVELGKGRDGRCKICSA